MCSIVNSEAKYTFNFIKVTLQNKNIAQQI